jgi:iron complex outermembrane recepter protein
MRISRQLAFTTSLLTSIALAAPVCAQSTAPEDEATEASGGIQEIIVTARKTAENLQTTPVAVSALTGADLEKQQIFSVAQLQTTTPNFTVSSAVAQPGSATLFIRGQGSSDGLVAIDQAVGAYLNGVYLARSTGGNFDMIDVQRVEVLRGPQGTLFGRNTTGGAINIIPNEPTGEFGGSIRADYGNYDAFLTRGVLNLPIKGDEFAVRIAGQHREHSGYGKNLSFGNDLNDANSEYVRVSAKIAPDESKFRFLLFIDASDFRNGGELVGLRHLSAAASSRDLLVNGCNGAGVTKGIQPLCSPVSRGALNQYVYNAPGSIVDFYDVYHNVNSYGKSKSRGIAGITEYEISDAAKIKSTTAWRRVILNSLSDNDGTPYHFTGGFDGFFGNQINQRQFTQELQLSGGVGPIDYILGGFYFVENGRDVSRSGSLFPLSTSIGFNDGQIRNRSVAGFGQLIYHVTDALRLTGGLRYTEDKRGLVSRNRNLAFLTGVVTSALPASVLDKDPSDPFRATFSRTYNYWSWLGSIDYQASDDLFFYAKASRSQRSGGFNTRITAAVAPPISFRPEQITDYEVGAKLDLLDRRVRFNVAAFHDSVKDVQRNIIGVVGTTLISGADNAAKARIQGVEAELTVAPVDGLTLRGNVGVTDAKYKKFINSIDLADYSNSEFPYTPKYTWSVSGDYDYPVGDMGSLKLHADYGWRSTQFATALALGAQQRVGLTPAQIAAGNQALQNTARIDSYGILNARIGFQFADPDLEIAAYVQNATRKKYITRLLALEATPFGLTSYLPGDPRTYGVSATYKF